MAKKKLPTRPLLSGFEFSKKLAFGGSKTGKDGRLLTGNPKEARPLHPKQHLHIVLRSSFATGRHSLLLKSSQIENILASQARISGVKLCDLANAGNHLHLIVWIPSRRALRKFLRSSAGLIARRILGAERGRPQLGETLGKKGFPKLKEGLAKFWDARPFTRIVRWGRDYNNLKCYLEINRVEMGGWDRLTTRSLLARIEDVARNGRLAAVGFS